MISLNVSHIYDINFEETQILFILFYVQPLYVSNETT